MSEGSGILRDRYPQLLVILAPSTHHISPRLLPFSYVTMHEPPSTVSDHHTVLHYASTAAYQSGVLTQEILSPEDKMVLYAVLQDIANELRRIKHERQKHQKAGNQQ